MAKFIDYISKDLSNNMISKSHKNIILYGSPITDTYTYAINYINQFSNSNLVYEKKIIIPFNSDEYIFRISDIHIEVNFQFLGCVSKNLWNVIFNHILQLASNRKFIILCKNFCSINNELIDHFYTYISSKRCSIEYIFLINNISCLPTELIDRCTIIPFDNTNLSHKKVENTYVVKLTDIIINHKSFNVITTRNVLYDMLIYQINIYETIYNLLKHISYTETISNEKTIKLMKSINSSLQLYNNNYRSIYHIESIIVSFITILYDESI